MSLVAIFVLGYLAIVFEHPLRVNKAASALLMGVALWSVLAIGGAPEELAELGHHVDSIAQIVFFLLGAMTIVELIDAHDGFELVTSRITTRSRRKLFVVVAVLAFLLSAILDNLTTSIVMMSVARKLACDEEDRRYLGGLIIVAANAGGVWSPIGDVTTTMLWVGGQITTSAIITTLILPAIASLAVPLAWLVLRNGGEVARERDEDAAPLVTTRRERLVVFGVGMGALVFVPVFKTVTGLPPFMGILMGLAVLWIVTELVHHGSDERAPLSVAAALQRIDSQSMLFFIGILLAITALESAGLLRALATVLADAIGDLRAITMSIGLASSVVDNVPLVAAAQGMYPLTTYPTDHMFWLFLAFCAGTGGSILIIGSAAGIAVMGIQRITFVWYLRRFSLLALAGYLAGAGIFLAMNS